jgi:hypothetical protein
VSIELDFRSEVCIVLFDKVIFLSQYIPEFLKYLRSELRVIITYYLIVEMVQILRHPLSPKLKSKNKSG